VNTKSIITYDDVVDAMSAFLDSHEVFSAHDITQFLRRELGDSVNVNHEHVKDYINVYFCVTYPCRFVRNRYVINGKDVMLHFLPTTSQQDIQKYIEKSEKYARMPTENVPKSFTIKVELK